VKTILTAFFDAKGIIHHELMTEKQNVIGKFYNGAIKRMIAGVHHLRREFQESGSWYLLHDNAPAHSSGVVSKFWVKLGVPVLSYPPYSPYLAPADFSIS
jgi:hypothetical protein